MANLKPISSDQDRVQSVTSLQKSDPASFHKVQSIRDKLATFKQKLSTSDIMSRDSVTSRLNDRIPLKKPDDSVVAHAIPN